MTRGRPARIAALLAALLAVSACATAASAPPDPASPVVAHAAKKRHRPAHLRCPSGSFDKVRPPDVDLYAEVTKVVDAIAAQVVARGFTLKPLYGKLTGSTCDKLGPNVKKGHGQVHAYKYFPEVSQYPVEVNWYFYPVVSLSKKGKVRIVVTDISCEPFNSVGCFTPTYP